MDPVLYESAQTARAARWDVYVFVGAFITGALVYLGVRLGLEHLGVAHTLVQIVVTASIVLVMLIYAFVVSRIPRLRVRLDQAGDNAYYLGLLFTLMSMAVALWEFGTIVLTGDGQTAEESGARQIIANFGVALASTITGIFLRVILHQMRIDPADVESMTRIELSDASKRVRASLENVTNDLGRFHDEVRQRTSDVLSSLMHDTTETSTTMARDVRQATQELVESSSAANRAVLEQTSETTRLLGAIAAEAHGAVERLKAVEPPPLTLSRRLDKLSTSLESVVTQVEQVITQIDGTSGAAQKAASEMSKVASALALGSSELTKSQAGATTAIATAVQQFGGALDQVGDMLKRERALLQELEAASRRSAEESARAQAAAVQVLEKLTQVANKVIEAIRH